MDTLNITVRRKSNGQWELQPEHADVTGLSRPCFIRWRLAPATAREWQFAPDPHNWKQGSESPWFGQPQLATDGNSFIMLNQNQGGKRHDYTLFFRNRSTSVIEERDPSIQNHPRPNAFRRIEDRDLILIGGAVVVGGLLALLLARPGWRRRDRDDIGYRDD